MSIEDVNLDALTDDFDGCSDVDDDGDGDYEFINEGASSQHSAGSEFNKNIFGSVGAILTNYLLSAKFRYNGNNFIHN